MTDSSKITCPRCKGKGYLPGQRVVYAGGIGTCFKCAGYGEVYKDKFYRAFGVGKTFYGITSKVWLNPNNPNNGTFKTIAAKGPDHEGFEEGVEHTNGGDRKWSYKVITEEQARKFWAKFGDQPVRVGDCSPEEALSGEALEFHLLRKERAARRVADQWTPVEV